MLGRSGDGSRMSARDREVPSMRVQSNGRYAIALVLDGIVFCVVPVGVPAMQSGAPA